jgi:hypothetical protein
MLLHLLDPITGTSSKVFGKANTPNLDHSTFPLWLQLSLTLAIIVTYCRHWDREQQENESDDETSAVLALRAMNQNRIIRSGGIRAKSIGDLRPTMIDRVESQSNKTSRLHNFTPENGDCFHAIAEDHKGDELARTALGGDDGFLGGNLHDAPCWELPQEASLETFAIDVDVQVGHAGDLRGLCESRIWLDESRDFEVPLPLFHLVCVLGPKDVRWNERKGWKIYAVRRSMMVLMPYSSFRRFLSDRVASSGNVSARYIESFEDKTHLVEQI